MPDNETLKPCPFCGSVAELLEPEDDGVESYGWWITCSNEQCAVHPNLVENSATSEEAITAWNRRVTPSQIPWALDSANPVPHIPPTPIREVQC